jgi:hypothetical protein
MRTTLTPSDLRLIGDRVGLRVDIGTTRGRFTNFRLRLGEKTEDGTRKYQRVSSRWSVNDKPRKVGAVCFHGHYAFMREAFDLAPDAVIESQLARYDGKRDFEIKAPEVGNGRPPHTLPSYVPGVHGTTFNDSCTCNEELREDLGGC